jgi:hypothetical protein
MGYRPGIWAKASAIVGGGGYIVNIWWAAHYGVDTSLAAFVHVFVVLLLAIVPMIFGTGFFWVFRRSQRAGDWAFAVCMIGQGIFLAVGPGV